MKILVKIWKDPVGSKLIASLIIAFVTSVGIFIKAIVQDETFLASLISFFLFDVPLWSILVLALLIYLVIKLWQYFFKTKVSLFTYDDETLGLDRALFNRIRNNILPQNTAIGFLRHNNFAGFSFNPEILNDLHRIEYENTNSDFEFLNPQLEKLKEELLSSIDEFTSIIAIQTFRTPQGRQTVPPEWELEQPERFDEVVESLHRTKHEVCRKYDELIKTGRRILKI